ncbi:MAG: TetM/TetW/TetO/TetS family tetracycline resistance ribosomal protection protein [Firmicutes bacterium]|nr:TetM/TetW/TetO/TetS family tetracycline resistance ribosomal protection protein [Bacillota bacterium]
MSKERRITIGILAHVDAGKTTLSEALLYKAGAIRKIGRVDHGDAVLDSDAQEKERGITIFAGQAVFHLPSDSCRNGEERSLKVTLLDTPGHVDFSAEMERVLSVLDYAVLVISGRDGVQSHTSTLWKLLKRYQIPVFLFVNKMDLDGTDREEIMARLQNQLDSACCDMSGSYEEIAMCSETLLEEYLQRETLSSESIAKAIKAREMFPCYFGSALKMDGVDAFMEAMGKLTIPYGVDADCAEESQPFAYRVFRVTRDKQGERLTHMKILSGTLHVRDDIGGEKVNQIRIYSGEKYTTIEEATAGNICQITGPVSLLPEGKGSLEALMVYDVLLPDNINEHDAFAKLKQLGEEDPQLQVTWNSQLKTIQMKLMGEVQLEILQELIKRRFGIDVRFSEGRIAYRETIAKPVYGAGHYEPLRHYAEVHLLLEPLPRGSGMQFDTAVSEDVLARNWQRLIMTHFLEKEHVGTLTGAPITDMRITIQAGRAHEKHTEGGDFRQATYRAIRQGLRKSLADDNMVLLEPWYEFELEVPQEMVGRAMSDVQRMSGSCNAPEGGAAGDLQRLTGRAPVSEMKEYVTEVASYTKGRGRLALAFGGYDVCHNQEEVVLASGYEPDADVEESADSVFCSHGAGHLVRWDEADEMMHLSVTAADAKVARPESTATGGPAASSRLTSGSDHAADKELQRIFDRTFKSSKSEKPSIEAREFDSELERRKKAAERRRRAAEAEKRREEMLLPEYLLVDGYNIIFAWDELKELAKENIDSAREALIEVLGNYQGYRKCKVIAVFDAYKVKGGQRHFEKHGGVTVVYTKEAETADTYIERTTYELAGKGGTFAGGKYRVRVATSDRLEQMIILGNNAQRVSAKDFRTEVEQVNEEIRDYLKQLERRNEIENPNKLEIERSNQG